MNTRDIAAEYRLTHWAQVVQDRVEKGISIRLYCKEVGIHENTYFYWQWVIWDQLSHLSDVG